MIIFGRNKLDPIVKLKLCDREDRIIPAVVILKTPLSNRLKTSISKNGGKIKYEYEFMNAVSGSFTPDGIDKLSELPEVLFISYDRKANICMENISSQVGVNLNNPYLLTGKGVCITIIDTGVYAHGDLIRPGRAVTYFKDYINSYTLPYDDNGHGTHICGIIAGSGALSEGKSKGVAPQSKLIMLKAFNSVGEGSFSDILAAMNWVAENMEKYNIRILCLPFGADAIVPRKLDPLCRASKALWDRGIIVIAASGNKGPANGTITTPGIESSIITAGCCDTTGIDIKKWKVPDFSSRGFKSSNSIKPELIAPGVNIMSLSSDKGYIPIPGRRSANPNLETPYTQMSGSSVSAAVTAGCIALIMEKTPGISGKDLKGLLKLSCRTLNEGAPSQGWGAINLKELVN